MDGNQSVLVQAIHQRNLLSTYRDQKYAELIYRLNTNAANIIKDDLGSNFIMNCGHDFAGEIVRNFFNTSDYYLTVDQLAMRILKFDYENDYDPLSENGSAQNIRKDIYNYNDVKQAAWINDVKAKLDMGQSTINTIQTDKYQENLFEEDRKNDRLCINSIRHYRNDQKDDFDNLTDSITNNINSKLDVDHIQSRESAKYNAKYITDDGKDQLKAFWNSEDNFQLMFQSANRSKNDIRVCDVNGKIEYKTTNEKTYDPKTDITHRASPEQLAQATILQWEKDTGSEKIPKMIEQGYLVKDEKGNIHVPRCIRKKLEQNIRHSQNTESKVILQNTDYATVAKDAASATKSSFGKILAGQIMYYVAPPLVYEIRDFLKNNKKAKLEGALQRLKESGQKIWDYLKGHLGDIIKKFGENSIKTFIKSFMDFLINMVKATIKKILKFVKSLLLSVVDAIKIIATPGTSKAQKGDAVFNLFGVTITNFAIDILFDLINNGLHLPDFVLLPLQILTSVICTNLVMLILQKADLFDVRFGFKMNAIRQMFEQENQEYQADMELASTLINSNVEKLIAMAEIDCRNIYNDLIEIDIMEQSVRESLEKCNTMFMMNIDFDNAWAEFIGQKPIYLIHN